MGERLLDLSLDGFRDDAVLEELGEYLSGVKLIILPLEGILELLRLVDLALPSVQFFNPVPVGVLERDLEVGVRDRPLGLVSEKGLILINISISTKEYGNRTIALSVGGGIMRGVPMG